MYDIVKCPAPPESAGYGRCFSFNDARRSIAEAADLREAAQLRNKKTLIVLRDHSFDEGAIRLVAEKKCACFLLDLGKLIRMRGVPRAIAMSKLRIFLGHCVKYGAPYAFATFAEKESEMRTPQEMESIACLLGINRGQARFALMMLPHYVSARAQG